MLTSWPAKQIKGGELLIIVANHVAYHALKPHNKKKLGP